MKGFWKISEGNEKYFGYKQQFIYCISFIVNESYLLSFVMSNSESP